MALYFRPAQDMPKVYLYRDPVDFRKQSAGLAAIVEQGLGHNPFDGGLYAFSNRQRNKVKCLFWEDNGFCLYYKRLEQKQFHWPRHLDDEVVTLSGQQLNWLLDGFNIKSSMLAAPHKYNDIT